MNHTGRVYLIEVHFFYSLYFVIRWNTKLWILIIVEVQNPKGGVVFEKWGSSTLRLVEDGQAKFMFSNPVGEELQICSDHKHLNKTHKCV